MPSLQGTARRGLVALVLAFGLALMHGGIGQAMACNGVTAMASSDMTMAATGDAMPADNPALDTMRAQHHQPGHEPVSAHSSQMCVSTPALHSGGGTKAGPATLALVPVSFTGQPRHVVTISRATGRAPPAPDLVSVLCVNRR